MRRHCPGTQPRRPRTARRAATSSLLLLVCALWLLPSTQAGARTGDICDAAAQAAARRTGVPLDVLRAITRTETGRNRNGEMQPWPWTVNMEGKGVWFDTEDAARAYVYRHFKQGARSFDVGCFQINYRWHHEGFSSIDEMFEPLANAVYAGEFLQRLHAETGSWSAAAGAYHSRTPEYSDRYRRRFDRIRTALTATDPAPQPRTGLATRPSMPATAPASGVERVNRYPLLRAASSIGDMGSLVPLSRGATPLLAASGRPVAGAALP